MKKVVIIGSGFAGISAASFMAKAGWDVTVVEKHATPGGRARQLLTNGFSFDMGPSWYWMPGVFEKYFNHFGKKVSDYYELTRLSPSYKIYWEDLNMDIPADFNELKILFESIEKGSAARLDKFMHEAAYKYKVGIEKLVYKPGRSLTEFMDWDIIKGIFKLDVFTSMKKHVAKYFKHPKLQQVMEFPVLFLGALPKDIPALYSLMNYADIKLGTWFPKGGMYSVVKAMYNLAEELGVKFYFNHDVTNITLENSRATHVIAKMTTNHQPQNIDNKSPNTQYPIPNSIAFKADVVIGAADYHFIENTLLPVKYQSYKKKYWDKRVMAPSCLLYYIGINKKLKNILHHSLFFDVSFDVHGKQIYADPQWPAEPLFYVSATSVTDSDTAPEGHENLFFLIPVASSLEGDTEILKDDYFKKILDRFEKLTGETIRNNIVYKSSFSVSDFISEYNSFKGNAYGLANTLMQTALLKPGIRSKKIKNLYYTGQLTVPGPGVPPSLISGEVVAKEIVNFFYNKQV
ncbi:MAG: phytoene desaturase [Chitinophagaceae bacterium]|nr:phytoene desaturase [Chitinophagaceae bacterium]